MASSSTVQVMLVFSFVVLSIYVAEVAASGYCPSYCDLNGLYYEGHHCHHYPDVYCCGTGYHLECCANKSRDVSGYYPEKYNCNTTSWFEIHWQVMITMTGTIILVMLFAACCCQCCKICGEKVRQREHAIHFSSSNSNMGTTVVTDSDGNQFIAETTEASGGENSQVRIQMFNPESPFAFTPPEYEDLPKEPPKYYEVFGADAGGNINPCYIPETPPPTFTEAVSLQSPAQAQAQAQAQAEALHAENQNDSTDLQAADAQCMDDAKNESESSPLDSNGAEPRAQSSSGSGAHRVPAEAQPLNHSAAEFVDVDLTCDDEGAGALHVPTSENDTLGKAAQPKDCSEAAQQGQESSSRPL